MPEPDNRLSLVDSVSVVVSVPQEYLGNNSAGDQNASGTTETMVHVGDGFYIAKQLYDRLFNYQHEGLLFFWRLFRKKKGGILGDDMG